MAHIIISAVLLCTAVLLRYAHYLVTKEWQGVHSDEIDEIKRSEGEDMTLFPRGYHKTASILGICTLGGLVYLVISILLHFFV